jgi:hypothetical protein
VAVETVAAGTAEDASFEQRRADALGLVAESALAAGLDPGTRGDRYQVVVHVDAEVLAPGREGGSSWFDWRGGPVDYGWEIDWLR